MDADRFDTLTRSLMPAASRRGLLAGLRGGLLAVLSLGLTEAEAKKKGKKKKDKNGKNPSPPPPPGNCTPNCADRTCGSDGCGGSCGACDAGQRCQGGTCLCVPESRNTTCGGHCGDRINNCGQTIGCPTCSGGRACLGNGSCAHVCGGGGCPSGCSGCSLPSAEGQSHCIANASSVGQACTSTAECPHGQHCQAIMPTGQACIGLC